MNNELMIYGEIGGFDGIDDKQFAKDLAKLGNVSDITVRINSPGGDLFAALAIYNLLVNHRATVRVMVDGLAASAASVIAMAGKEIILARNSMFMIHSPLSFSYGNARDLRTLADLLDKVEKDTLVSTYAAKSGLAPEKIQEMLTAETWLSAQEALDLGLATSIGDLNGDAQLDNRWMNILSKYSKCPKNLLVPEKVEAKEEKKEEQVIDYSAFELDLLEMSISANLG